MRKGRKKGLNMGWLCCNTVGVEKYYLTTILMYFWSSPVGWKLFRVVVVFVDRAPNHRQLKSREDGKGRARGGGADQQSEYG